MKSTLFTKSKPTLSEAVPFNHPELDCRLPLQCGELALLEYEGPAPHHLQILRYFLTSDRALLVTDHPVDLTMAVEEASKQQPTEKAKESGKNVIAWRYNSQEKAISGRHPTLGLGKSGPPIPTLQAQKLTLQEFQIILARLQKMVTSPKDTVPIRLAILMSPGSEVAQDFMAALARLVRMNLMACLFVLPGGHPALHRLQFSASYHLRAGAAGKGYEHLTGVLYIAKNSPLSCFQPGEQAELGMLSSRCELFISRLFENAEDAPMNLTACGTPPDMSF